MSEAIGSDSRLDWNQLIETALTVEGSVGNTYNRFYDYSFTNQMLLMMQGVCEPVATYKRWQDLGRQVLKGSKAKAIVRPVFIEKKDEAGEVTASIKRFKMVKCLFGVSETEGEELPPFEVPAWNMDQALTTLEVRQVPYSSLNGNSQGYSMGRDFAINPVAVNPLRTTFHELGHIVLGHTEGERRTEYATHRGLMEFQAEATAYLTTNELGVQTDEDRAHSRGYIQGWLRDERPPEASIREVFSATDRILKAGRQVAPAGLS